MLALETRYLCTLVAPTQVAPSVLEIHIRTEACRWTTSQREGSRATRRRAEGNTNHHERAEIGTLYGLIAHDPQKYGCATSSTALRETCTSAWLAIEQGDSTIYGTPRSEDDARGNSSNTIMTETRMVRLQTWNLSYQCSIVLLAGWVIISVKSRRTPSKGGEKPGACVCHRTRSGSQSFSNL